MFVPRKQIKKERKKKEEEKAGIKHTFIHPTACD
jgi:hypothetical protein